MTACLQTTDIASDKTFACAETLNLVVPTVLPPVPMRVGVVEGMLL